MGRRGTRPRPWPTSARSCGDRETPVGRAELAAEGLRIQRAFDNAVGTAQFLEILAWIAATERQHPRAARLLGAADEIWHAIDASLFPYLLGYRARDREERPASAGRAGVRDGLPSRASRAAHADNVAFALDEPEEPVRREPTAARSASSPGESARSPTSSRTA